MQRTWQHPQLMALSGCAAGGGKPLGSAWACPGTFAKGAAESLCAADYALCSAATGIDLVACGALTGFFIAKVPGKRNLEPPAMAVCGAADGGAYLNPLWYGCGRIDFAKDRTVNAQNPCGGFSQSLDCQVTGWTCTGSDISHAQNVSVPADGVLCCKR